MCGYLRQDYGQINFSEALSPVGLGDVSKQLDARPPGTVNILPAVVGLAHRKIPDVVIQEDGKRKLVAATWWFDCEEVEGNLQTKNLKSFNARDLRRKLWRNALETQRGIAVATGLGESRLLGKEGKTKHQFLMLADEPLLFGVLYQRFPHNLYSCAVITRDAQLGFDAYHDRAFPLFLRPEKKFIDLWLDPNTPSSHPMIADALAHPKWYTDLAITRVKSFSGGKLFKSSKTHILKAA